MFTAKDGDAIPGSTTTEPEDYSGLVNKLQQILKEYYEPVQDARSADLHFSTKEIYEQLQKVLPHECYTADMVANWMHGAGFTFADYGEMRFEWIMKKVA